MKIPKIRKKTLKQMQLEQIQLERRRLELKRKVDVTAIESECMNLEVNSSKTFLLMDIQAYQSIKARLRRLKLKTGVVYDTVIEGDNITVTRTA
jgi:hypothetical protein